MAAPAAAGSARQAPPAEVTGDGQDNHDDDDDPDPGGHGEPFRWVTPDCTARYCAVTTPATVTSPVTGPGLCASVLQPSHEHAALGEQGPLPGRRQSATVSPRRGTGRGTRALPARTSDRPSVRTARRAQTKPQNERHQPAEKYNPEAGSVDLFSVLPCRFDLFRLRFLAALVAVLAVPARDVGGTQPRDLVPMIGHGDDGDSARQEDQGHRNHRQVSHRQSPRRATIGDTVRASTTGQRCDHGKRRHQGSANQREPSRRSLRRNPSPSPLRPDELTPKQPCVQENFRVTAHGTPRQG